MCPYCVTPSLSDMPIDDLCLTDFVGISSQQHPVATLEYFVELSRYSLSGGVVRAWSIARWRSGNPVLSLLLSPSLTLSLSSLLSGSQWWQRRLLEVDPFSSRYNDFRSKFRIVHGQVDWGCRTFCKDIQAQQSEPFCLTRSGRTFLCIRNWLFLSCNWV